MPVGLAGLLKMISRVRGVMARRTSSIDDDLVTGVQQREECQDQAPAGAGGHKHLAIGVVVTAVDIRLQDFQQRSNALRLAVGIATFLDGFAQCILDGLRGIVVRLSDAEVDGTLHGSSQIENFANARRIDFVHAIGNPALTHG